MTHGLLGAWDLPLKADPMRAPGAVPGGKDWCLKPSADRRGRAKVSCSSGEKTKIVSSFLALSRLAASRTKLPSVRFWGLKYTVIQREHPCPEIAPQTHSNCEPIGFYFTICNYQVMRQSELQGSQ